MDKRKLKQRRTFSEQIKRKAVKQFRSGKYSAIELADLYHCVPQTIYNWIYKYSPHDQPKINVVEMADSNDKKRKDLQKRIEELEAALGRKQIKIDFQAKMIDLAKEDYDLDLKKNISIPPSNGSENTEKT